jgi:hypothetical protein
VARGFDSKSVTEQQEELLRRREPLAPAAPPASPRRRTLELARHDLVRRLAAAPELHRESLRQALAELDELIEKA